MVGSEVSILRQLSHPDAESGADGGNGATRCDDVVDAALAAARALLADTAALIERADRVIEQNNRLLAALAAEEWPVDEDTARTPPIPMAELVGTGRRP